MAKRAAGAEFTAWVRSLNFSFFTVGIVVLVIVGVWMLSPGVTTLVEQRREIAELNQSVKLHREAVDEIEAERVRWQDPAYIRAQARDRLFYVMPGETQLSVIQDVVIPVTDTPEASPELRAAESDWLRGLVGSVLVAGTTTAEPDELAGDAKQDAEKEQ